MYVSSLLFSLENIYGTKHKALLLGYSMRLELTLFRSLNVFLLWVLYRGHPLFFLKSVYLNLLYPSLMFDMFLSLSVYVSALGWFWVSLTVIFLPCV